MRHINGFIGNGILKIYIYERSIIMKNIKLLISVIFILNTAAFINSNNLEIHLMPLDKLNVDNTNCVIKLYFKADKATAASINALNQNKVVYRESPNSRKKGYFLLEPLTSLSPKNVQVLERMKDDDKNFVTITEYESELKIEKAPKEFKIFTLLLLDVSGSITKKIQDKQDPVLEKLKSSANKFVDSIKLDSGNKNLAVYAFDGREELLPIVDFTNNGSRIKDEINTINSEITKDESTNLYGAILNGLNILNDKYNESKNEDFIFIGSLIVFTDGTDRAGRLGSNGYIKLLNSIEDAKKQKNLYLYTLGLGREIDLEKLRRLGEDGFVFSINTNALAKDFQYMAEEIEAITNSYYKLEYKTPSRKGSGKKALIIYAKDGMFNGGLRVTFDTENFLK